MLKFSHINPIIIYYKNFILSQENIFIKENITPFKFV